jgi:hypothetical protein
MPQRKKTALPAKNALYPVGHGTGENREWEIRQKSRESQAEEISRYSA